MYFVVVVISKTKIIFCSNFFVKFFAICAIVLGRFDF